MARSLQFIPARSIKRLAHELDSYLKTGIADDEWELLEPLLPQVLLPKKYTRPPAWIKQELMAGVLY